MKITVDRAKCTGIGMCELAAPAVFEVGEDAQSHVIGTVDEAAREQIVDAVNACPTRALSLQQ
jgi:ferredoxin